MRPLLAKPRGRLYRTAELSGPEFTRVVTKARLLVSVGDRVTETLGGMGRPPDVQVVDGLENRRVRTPPEVEHVRTIRVKNPPGTITLEAVKGIREAYAGKKPARVLVEGEEDLLAIPAVVLAPEGTAVFYGQPGEGIVKLSVSKVSKARNQVLLGRMGVPRLK